jgi:hypothetical protein
MALRVVGRVHTPFAEVAGTPLQPVRTRKPSGCASTRRRRSWRAWRRPLEHCKTTPARPEVADGAPAGPRVPGWSPGAVPPAAP